MTRQISHTLSHYFSLMSAALVLLFLAGCGPQDDKGLALKTGLELLQEEPLHSVAWYKENTDVAERILGLCDKYPHERKTNKNCLHAYDAESVWSKEFKGLQLKPLEIKAKSKNDKKVITPEKKETKANEK